MTSCELENPSRRSCSCLPGPTAHPSVRLSQGGNARHGSLYDIALSGADAGVDVLAVFYCRRCIIFTLLAQMRMAVCATVRPPAVFPPRLGWFDCTELCFLVVLLFSFVFFVLPTFSFAPFSILIMLQHFCIIILINIYEASCLNTIPT